MNLSALGRSLRRIAIATVTLATALFLIAAALMRQPALTRIPYRVSRRASPENLERDVRVLTTTIGPRDVRHAANLDAAADYIASAFRAAGARVREQAFDARGVRCRNVIAELGPDDRTKPLWVIGAHYDAFTITGHLPAADDNASGTAALLELARLLARERMTQPIELVAFVNEEPPFFGSEQMGSAVHAAALERERRPVGGMLSLEMIGYYADAQPWPSWLLALMYPSRGDFIGVTGGWNDRHLARFVKRAIRGAGGVRVVSFTGPHDMTDASDQRNYWSRGWPAVMITDTAYVRNPNYHTVHDTADTLDYTRIAAVVDGLANAALALRDGAAGEAEIRRRDILRR